MDSLLTFVIIAPSRAAGVRIATKSHRRLLERVPAEEEECGSSKSVLGIVWVLLPRPAGLL